MATLCRADDAVGQAVVCVASLQRGPVDHLILGGRNETGFALMGRVPDPHLTERVPRQVGRHGGDRENVVILRVALGGAQRCDGSSSRTPPSPNT